MKRTTNLVNTHVFIVYTMSKSIIESVLEKICHYLTYRNSHAKRAHLEMPDLRCTRVRQSDVAINTLAAD